MLERDIERAVMTWAKGQGCICLKLNLIGNTGWPDRLFLYNGKCVFIEFKRPGGKLHRNQPQRINALRAQGFTAEVFDNVDNAITFLESTLLSKGGS